MRRPDGKVVRYVYDALGRRVRKDFDGKLTEYVWDGDELVHERTTNADGSHVPLVTWLFEPGTFTPAAKLEGGKRYGVVSDHLGSPTILTTEAGRIAWRAQLDIWGVASIGDPEARPQDATTCPWRWPGQYEDEETGLYYNRFRYYDPEMGRYISPDPIGLEGGLGQYAYVHDPLGWVDPRGLAGCRGSRNPSTSAAARRGMAMHKLYEQLGLAGQTVYNRALPSGLRPDAVDFANRIVRELKPDNPRAIARGWKQASKYAQELQRITGGTWTIVIDTYK